MRQVFAAALKTYPRPIPTPVHNLRPAQETCEACHWPRKFYGGQLKVFTHYASDQQNTPMQIRMIIKTGGGDPATGAPEGIHWHMNIANQIDYVATDEHRQVIPYVHVRDLQGRVTDAGVQLHGGYGYMEEYPIARMWTDSRISRIYAGANEVMKDLIARSL